MLDTAPPPAGTSRPAPGPLLDLVLDDLADAYARGDAARGELLLERALDLGLPWDAVCAAAARGTASHYGERHRA